MKKLLRTFLILGLAVIMILGFLGVSIKKFGDTAQPVKSDCIIILGCRVYGDTPSPFLIGRMEEGLRLYKKGYGKYVIVTGGMGSGEYVTEAAAMEKYLISKGIPKSNILVENKSKSTLENLKFSKIKMDALQLNSAIIVTNKYHLKRAFLISRKLHINSSFSGIYLSNYKSYEVSGFLREILALLKYYLIGFWRL